MIVPLTYYAQRISWVKANGYHHEKGRENQISNIIASNVRKAGMSLLGSLLEVRSFILEKMPEYLELFDTKRCMARFEEFLTFSLLNSDEELYRIMRKHLQDVFRRYPSMQGGFMDRIKRDLKYHYWIARPLIKMKFSLGSLF